jgi:hypothetical protein
MVKQIRTPFHVNQYLAALDRTEELKEVTRTHAHQPFNYAFLTFLGPEHASISGRIIK